MENLDWYERVVQHLPQQLYDACGIAEELMTEGHFHLYTSKTEKHPTISVIVSFNEGEYDEEPFVIHFDPYNQEFYTIVPEELSEVRLMLHSSEDIVDFMHEQIHIAQMAHNAGESVMDAADGNEQAAFHQFIDMVQSFGGNPSHMMPSGGFDEFEEGVGLFHELIASSEIEWFPKNIVTESVNKADENFQKVTTIRIGQFVGTETYVLGRVDTVTVDREIESEHTALFPFEKGDITALQEILKIL